MRVLSAALISAAAITGANAQPPQPPSSPMEQALGAKLMQEINAGLQCSAGIVQLQKQVADLTKERDDLKAKATEEPAKQNPQ